MAGRPGGVGPSRGKPAGRQPAAAAGFPPAAAPAELRSCAAAQLSPSPTPPSSLNALAPPQPSSTLSLPVQSPENQILLKSSAACPSWTALSPPCVACSYACPDCCACWPAAEIPSCACAYSVEAPPESCGFSCTGPPSSSLAMASAAVPSVSDWKYEIPVGFCCRKALSSAKVLSPSASCTTSCPSPPPAGWRYSCPSLYSQ